MSSAFALVPAAISPSIVTSAVCRPPDANFASLEKSISANASSRNTARNAKRKKIFQRRAARCSLTAASAIRSSAARSQFGSRLSGRDEDSGKFG